MGRKVQHNNIVSDELLARVNPENIELGKDFLDYLRSIDRAGSTIEAYSYDLNIFWVYLLQYCNNKFFIDLSKREISKYQSHCLTEWKWSPARMRRVKSTLSSLSNYVENMLDDEFEDFRPIIRKIENPTNEKVLEKTVLEDTQLDNLLNILVEKKQYDKACMLSMAMNNGRRKSELPRFKVFYFDDKNIIYGSLYKTPEKIKTKGRGSRGKLLTAYTLSKPFKPYFDLWMNYRKENNIKSEWLFPKKVNGEYIDEPISPKTLDSWADTFSNILGVDFYWHSLRHYFTTACSRSGLPDNVIQMLIGWSTLDMVNIYKDIEADEEFEKYFSEDGINQVEKKSLSDL
nr:MAG TPA: Integrase [Caudoviricetes sp.]